MREIVVKCLEWAVVILMKSHSHPTGHVLTEEQAADKQTFIKGNTTWD